MTPLGLYLAKKSASKAEIAKKTGLSKSRLSELTNKANAHLRARELYLIALALDADPGEMFRELFKEEKLPS